MNVLITACTYLLIIFGGVAGVIAFATIHDYQSMSQVMSAMPDHSSAVRLLLFTLFAMGCALTWEWYRRASRGE